MGLNVETHGSGPDLVLLHGWGTNAAVWDEMTTHLSAHFRVHCVDLPGHGSSPACEPYTLDAIVDALTAVLPPQLSVCGWSLGGQVALYWALRRGAQVERLVVIATTPRFVRDEGWESAIAGGMLENFAQSLARDCQGTLQRFAVLQAQGDASMRMVLRRLRESMLEHGEPDVAALSAALRVLGQTDLRCALPQVKQAVLLLHGDRDTLVPSAAGTYLQRALPRAALEIVAGAAHAPFISQPQFVARHITEFCSGQ